MSGYLGVILIRGLIGAKCTVKDTVKIIGLKKKMHLAVLEDNPTNRGMIRKIKDYITWGELPDGEEILKKGKIVPLHPPRGGFERGGIKVPFNSGGALGYRGEKIKSLIERMNNGSPKKE